MRVSKRRLTDAQVLELRALPRREAAAHAASLGLGATTASNVWGGRTYRHLPVPPRGGRDYSRAGRMLSALQAEVIRKAAPALGRGAVGKLSAAMGISKSLVRTVVRRHCYKEVV